MKFFYHILIFKVGILLPIVALFNKKINRFVEGRKETFDKLSNFNDKDQIIWIHAASLGEFEQARPIIEAVKKWKPEYKILVSFFSPSGYEIRKNYELADVVCYLPLDSKSNTTKFVNSLNLKMAIFIKYEFWPNFLNELKKQEIPTILVSGILRKNQLFFKWYGGFMRKALFAFNHFFVQDGNSKDLLHSIDFNNVTVSGDTRFDRVSEILNQDHQLDFVSEFKNTQYTLVAGSTWPEDENLIVNYINNQSNTKEKFIIVPHNINAEAVLKLQQSINRKTILYSEKTNRNLAAFQVLIIDTIGLLTKIYKSADIAYVGGGLKTGLHNILEPATFGVPIVIGNHFEKFKEARDLVSLKGCIAIKNQHEFSSALNLLKNDKILRNKTGKINETYVKENLGATTIVLNYLKSKL